MERARRFERPTLTLARLCSTPELRPPPLDEGWDSPGAGGLQEEKCGGAVHARTGPKHEKAPGFNPAPFSLSLHPEDIGAGEAIRTPDPNLGKVMLYP